MELYDEKTFDGPGMIRLLWRQKWWVIGTTVIVVVITLFITFMLPKKYVASGIVFPPSTNDLETFMHQPRYGYDVEADRLIQMLQSESLRDTIVKMFDLMDYYGLDTSSADWNKKLNENFYRDIDFTRSRYMSVIVTARMDHPKLSADIVNALIDKVDVLRKRVFEKSLAQQLKSLEKEYNNRINKVKLLGDSLFAESQKPGKRSLRLLYYQMKFGEGFVMNEAGVNSILGKSATDQISPEDELLASNYLGAQKDLQESREKLERINAMIERPVPGIYVLDRANPNFEKVFPSYKKNVAIAGGASLVLSIISVLLIARIREIFATT